MDGRHRSAVSSLAIMSLVENPSFESGKLFFGRGKQMKIKGKKTRWRSFHQC